MPVIQVMMSTIMEVDTSTGKSRITKHWQKILGTPNKKTEELVGEQSDAEFID